MKRARYADSTSVSDCLSYNLRKFRKDVGLTQAKLAQKAGLSLPCVQLIESGKRWPERDTIARIADALDVLECDLFVPTGSFSRESSEKILDMYLAVEKENQQLNRDMEQILHHRQHG